MITVGSKTFRRAIALASQSVDTRNTIPILSTLKVKANGSLSFEGTDLDNCTLAQIAYEGDEAEFVLANPRKVSAAVGEAGASAVTLQVLEKGDVSFQSGALSSSGFAGHVDDHPAGDRIAEELFGCDLGASELQQIARVIPAISTEETRYYLNGICVKKIGEWLYRFAATDGHRLMFVDIPLPGATGEIPDATIIPRRFVNIALASFKNAKDGVRLAYGPAVKTNRSDGTLGGEATGSPRIALSGAVDDVNFSLTGKLIDGTYPDYSRVIPTANDKVVRCARADLVKAIRSLTPMSTDRTRAVRMTIADGELRLELHSPEIGKSAFSIPADHRIVHGFEIGFNARYLLEMLAVLNGDEVEMQLADASAPVLVFDPSDTSFRAVLMPMRV